MRKIDPENQYNINIHKNGGHQYASTQPRVYDEKTGKYRYVRKHWGTVDENLKFHPNMDYVYASLEERKKLKFPDNWDLSEIEKLSGNHKPGRPVIESNDENRLYGDVWLMEKIAEETGLKKDLLDTFGGNSEIVANILTVAMFTISDNRTYSHMVAWQRITKTPASTPLSPSQLTRLTQSITNQHRMDLFRNRKKRLTDCEFCAVDSTTVSTYGSSLADIRWGKNKERIPLPQTIEVVVYTLSRHMPIYYRSFPGNIPDSRTLETIIHDLELLGLTNIIAITDRGYDCIRNLEIYIYRGMRMIMGVKTNQKLVASHIPSFKAGDTRPEGMALDPATKLYYQQSDLEYQIEGARGNVKKTNKLKLNLYFDTMRRAHDSLEIELQEIEQADKLKDLIGKEIPQEDMKELKKIYWLYTLEIDSKTRVLKGYVLNTKKRDQYMKDAGFFANLTQGLDLTAMDANHHYRLRDEQEKYFTKAKSILGYDRLRTSTEDGKAGRDFILFVAQIILCRIEDVYKTELSEMFPSVSAILDEMRPIRCIEHANTQAFITPFVGKQIDICKAFGFEIPEGCAPEYVVRKTNKGKRGRPKVKKEVTTDN